MKCQHRALCTGCRSKLQSSSEQSRHSHRKNRDAHYCSIAVGMEPSFKGEALKISPAEHKRVENSTNFCDFDSCNHK